MSLNKFLALMGIGCVVFLTVWYFGWIVPTDKIKWLKK